MEFRDFLNRKKQYRDLDDIYKTSRFLQLYLKMYEYILSIPKDKIVHKKIQNDYYRINALFLNYIQCFLKAKDFYHWRERLYKLMTEKICNTDYKKYELLYGQKAREFFDEYSEKRQKSYVKTSLERYGCENPWKSKEVREKIRQTNLERHGVENPSQCEEVKERIKQTNLKKRGCENPMQCEEVRERIKQTNLERYRVENPFQSEEVKEKIRNTNLERHGVENPFQSEEVKEKIRQTNIERHGVDHYSKTEEFKEKLRNTSMKHYGVENPFQSEEVKEKIRQTNLERYGVEYPFQTSEYTNHSKIADEFCINLYTKLSDDIKPHTIFFKKSNKEYMLEGNGKKYFYDFTIFMESIKVIVEFDGLYWHGLLEGQKDVRGVPVEEVWISDYEKERLAEMNGFKVIRVREDEYVVNKEECINIIVEEIMK